MAFLTDNDYKVVIGASALAIITQADADNRRTAEAEAQELISGYLRPVYNVTNVFAEPQQGQSDNRNRMIVMCMCDISLYNLSASMPQKMGSEVREERYGKAIEWLSAVQKGTIVPDLPLATDTEGKTLGSFRYGGDTKMSSNW